MQRYLWIDLETTGLDATSDFILEVAWIITDYKFGVPTRTQSYVISEDTGDALRTLDQNKFVTKMHIESGLYGYLFRTGTESIEKVEDYILGDMRRRTNEGDTWHLAGSSVHFDRAFIDNNMPELAAKLHHRILDVSSLKLLAAAVGLKFDLPENVNPHRAANDIEHSLDYAREFRDMLRTSDTRGTTPQTTTDFEQAEDTDWEIYL